MAGTTGTAGTAKCKFYSGSQPANADAGTSGTLLCTITGIGWTAATSGTSPTAGTSAFANTSGYTGTALETGTAGWARMETITANGTFGIDGDVGTGATCVFVINSPSFTSGGIVSLLSAPLYMA